MTNTINESKRLTIMIIAGIIFTTMTLGYHIQLSMNKIEHYKVYVG